MTANVIDMPSPPPGRFDDETTTDDRPMPPHDLDAEAVILSDCLTRESCAKVAALLKPHHFYSPDNGAIYLALRTLESTGRPIETPVLAAWLRDHGQAKIVGYMAEMLTMSPATAHVEPYVQIVVDKWRLRQTIATAHRIAADGYAPLDTAAYLRSAAKDIAAVTESAGTDDTRWWGGESVFEEQPETPWIVPGIYLAPGRPHLMIGYGYSGKTVAAMSLALSVANGRKVWGEFFVKTPGIVGHIDYEQGTAATKRRYVRLARAMGVTAEDIGANLRVTCLPRTRLSDDAAEDWLRHATEGMKLCILDSLRAAVLGVDENESSVREHIDKLLRVTERTGCTFLLIHHAKKSSNGNQKDQDAREMGRGSSAIFDAAGTVLHLTGSPPADGGEIIVKVAMSKAAAEASGGALAPFAIGISDVCSDDGGDDKWGLRVRHMTAQQADPPSTPQSRQAAMQHAIIAAVRQHPGMSGRAVLAAVEGKREHRWAALDELVRTGRLDETDGPRRSKNYSVPGSTDEGNVDED